MGKSGEDGYVYFIEARSCDRVKIGKATDPAQRLRDLQTGHFADLVLRLMVRSNDVYLLEARMHERYARAHERGEWFRLTPDMSRWLDEWDAIVISEDDLTSVRLEKA